MASTASGVRNVLFLCRINGGRSIMAEALLNHRAGGRYRAYSAGVEPGPAIPQPVLNLLARHGVPTGGLYPKSWKTFSGPKAPKLDFVITTCDRSAGESCPVWPGQPVRAHWSIDDPSTGQADPAERMARLEACYQHISRSIDLFLTMPEIAIDRIALGNRIDEIGAQTAA